MIDSQIKLSVGIKSKKMTGKRISAGSVSPLQCNLSIKMLYLQAEIFCNNGD